MHDLQYLSAALPQDSAAATEKKHQPSLIESYRMKRTNTLPKPMKLWMQLSFSAARCATNNTR
jgi:hypothetical protein